MKKNRMIFELAEHKAMEELVKKIEPMAFDLGLDVYHYTQCAEEVRRYLLPENVLVVLRRKGGWYAGTVLIEFFDSNSAVLPELVAMFKEIGCKETNA